MAIISFSENTLIDYIPAYGGNRESENPCVIKLRFVPYKKVTHYQQQVAQRGKDVYDPAKAAAISKEIQKKEFCESIDSVSGFLVDGQELTTAEELYDHAPAELIYELIKAMEDSAKLSEGQRKN